MLLMTGWLTLDKLCPIRANESGPLSISRLRGIMPLLERSAADAW
ncbi:hypothetical protein BH11PSE8_BH11PSE8_04870 [soil metagenome]